mgnify:CR=1 FL=1
MRPFYTEWSDSDYLRLSETTDNVNSMKPIRLSVTTQLQDATKPANFENIKLNFENFNAISFTHHFEILTKVKSENHRWYYIHQTAYQALFDTMKRILDNTRIAQ